MLTVHKSLSFEIESPHSLFSLYNATPTGITKTYLLLLHHPTWTMPLFPFANKVLPNNNILKNLQLIIVNLGIFILSSNRLAVLMIAPCVELVGPFCTVSTQRDWPPTSVPESDTMRGNTESSIELPLPSGNHRVLSDSVGGVNTK